MKVTPQIYIGSNRLDLYDDERIELVRSVKNYRDISKVLSDFTQSFTVPASRANNQALKHWYNIDLANNINPAVKQSGRIDINGIPFKTGVFALEKVEMEDGKPKDYTITFYSDLTGLTDLFGDDTLADLELSAYKVDYDDFPDYIDGTIRANIAVPLINSVTTSITNDLEGIYEYDLKPALSLARIVEAIESKYSITLSGFFDGSYFSNLFMWGHSNAGQSENFDNEYEYPSLTYSGGDVSGSTTAIWYDSTNDYIVYPANADSQLFVFTKVSNVETYDWIVYDLSTSGDQIIYEQTDIVGDASASFISDPTLSYDQHLRSYYRFKKPVAASIDILNYRSYNAGATQFDISVTADTFTNDIGEFHWNTTTKTETLTGREYDIPAGIPALKVREFISGLVNMFNLVILPSSSTSFDFQAWDDWQTSGTTLDITNYVKSDRYTVSPTEINGHILYKYKDPKYGANINFKKQNGVGYGDLQLDIVDTNGDRINDRELKVELPFENMLFRKDAPTGVILGEALDESGSPVVGEPIILYIEYGVGVPSGVFFTNKRYEGGTTYDSIYANYNRAYQFDTSNDSFTQSLNFGTEIQPATGNDGSASDPTLYKTYWEDYVTDLYDLQARRFQFKGVLPVSLLLQLELNDKLRIGNKVFRINTIRTDLTTGETMLDLLNEID